MRWLHCLDHADNIQKPAESPDCLLGVVTQLTDSRLNETNVTHVRRAQWLRGKTSDTQLREPRFESCAAVLKPWASFFTLHYPSSHSCMNEYLAIDSGGYVQPMRINCSMAGCFPEKLRLNRSVREVKCKSTLSSPEDWILRCIHKMYVSSVDARHYVRRTQHVKSNHVNNNTIGQLLIERAKSTTYSQNIINVFMEQFKFL